MTSLFVSSFCYAVLVFCFYVCTAQAETVSSAEASDDSNVEFNKRAWNMLRLGRGLQMLRLGKRSTDSSSENTAAPSRSARSVDSLDKSRHNLWTKAELRDMLAAMMGEARDETRRQPPLPRYGRKTDSFHSDLMELLGDADGGFITFRPAPRGGRYRRSVSGATSGIPVFVGSFFPEEFKEQFMTRAIPRPRIGRLVEDGEQDFDGKLFSRSIPRPRIGRFLENVAHVETKAIPRPRLGREKDSESSQ